MVAVTRTLLGMKVKLRSTSRIFIILLKGQADLPSMENFDTLAAATSSFVELFCYKKDGSSITKKKYIERDAVTSIQMDGIIIYLSRLAPVAIFGKDSRSKYIRENTSTKEEFYSGNSFLDPARNLGEIPAGYGTEEWHEIISKLAEAGYTLLDPEYVKQPLPFPTKIPTVLTVPDKGDVYNIFDAIFYWAD